MTLRRPKGSNNENYKDDTENDKIPFCNTTDVDTAEDTEAPNSQRSTQSIQNMTQRTNRTIKKINLSNATSKNLTTLPSSNGMLQQLNKQQTPTGKSIAVLRRFEQGDGDASSLNDVYNSTNFTNSNKQQNQHTNLSSLNKPEQISNNYEADENEEDEDDDGLEETQESEEDEITDNQQHEIKNNGNIKNTLDGKINNALENEEIIDDYYEESQKIEVKLFLLTKN